MAQVLGHTAGVAQPFALDVSVARKDEELAFLTSLSDGLARSDVVDVEEGCTSAVFLPLLASFEVPGVSTWRSSLDVFFDSGPFPWLYGSWIGGNDELDLDWSNAARSLVHQGICLRADGQLVMPRGITSYGTGVQSRSMGMTWSRSSCV